MTIRQPIFAEYLYLSEDEFNLLSVEVENPIEFMQKENIRLEYERSYELKLEESIIRYFESFFMKNYGFDELLYIVASNLGKTDLDKKIISYKDEVVNDFRKEMRELLNYHIFDDSYSTYGLDDGVPSHYASEIMEIIKGKEWFQSFLERLEHLQTGGKMVDYYKSKEIDFGQDKIRKPKREIDFSELSNLIFENSD